MVNIEIVKGDESKMVKKLEILSRPLQTRGSTTVSQPSCDNKQVVRKSNFDHKLFRITLENSSQYILEFLDCGYNLEPAKNQKFIFTVQETLELGKESFTLNQLIDLSKTNKKYSLLDYNCIHFVNEVLEKLKNKHWLVNPAQVIKIIGFFLALAASLKA